MYYLLGFKECLKIISLISKNHYGNDLKSLEELKVSLGIFLNNFQPKVPHKPFSKIFVTDKSICKQLVELYNAPSIVNDQNQDSMLEDLYEPELVNENCHKIKKILEQLKNLGVYRILCK